MMLVASNNNDILNRIVRTCMNVCTEIASMGSSVIELNVIKHL